MAPGARVGPAASATVASMGIHPVPISRPGSEPNKDPILRYWGLELQHVNFGGHCLAHNVKYTLAFISYKLCNDENKSGL